MNLFPLTPNTWQPSILKGDFALKSSQGFALYMKVEGMTRTKKVTRFVKGFSTLCPRGELGDTYIHDFDCLVDPEAWARLETLGWPMEIPKDFTVENRVRNGVTFPYLVVS